MAGVPHRLPRPARRRGPLRGRPRGARVLGERRGSHAGRGRRRPARRARSGPWPRDGERLPRVGGAGGLAGGGVSGEPSWSPDRRFARAFERLSLPGFGRGARYDLLCHRSACSGVFDSASRPPSQLGGGGARDPGGGWPPKRVFGIGDPLLPGAPWAGGRARRDRSGASSRGARPRALQLGAQRGALARRRRRRCCGRPCTRACSRRSRRLSFENPRATRAFGDGDDHEVPQDRRPACRCRCRCRCLCFCFSFRFTRTAPAQRRHRQGVRRTRPAIVFAVRLHRRLRPSRTPCASARGRPRARGLRRHHAAWTTPLVRARRAQRPRLARDRGRPGKRWIGGAR